MHRSRRPGIPLQSLRRRTDGAASSAWARRTTANGAQGEPCTEEPGPSMELPGPSRPLGRKARMSCLSRQPSSGLRVVGLSRATSLALVHRRMDLTFEALPVPRDHRMAGKPSGGETPVTFDSPSKTRTDSCRPSRPRRTRAEAQADRAAWDSSHGVVQRTPLRRHEHAASTPGTAPVNRASPSAWSCHLQARSALAVPPGFDGFLRIVPRRSVAPCSRPWGSPPFPALWSTDLGFSENPPLARRIASTRATPACAERPPPPAEAGKNADRCAAPSPEVPNPSKLFPRTTAVPGSLTRTGHLPSRRYRSSASAHPAPPKRFKVRLRASPTDLRALLRRRVRCSSTRCHVPKPDAPLGFASTWSPPPTANG